MNARHTLARGLVAACLCLPMFAVHLAHAQEAPEDYRVHKDIPYAQVDGRVLLFDLYLPRDTPEPPLLVWVHGGAWRRGSKDSVGPLGLASAGYAIASVDFRLSGEAPFRPRYTTSRRPSDSSVPRRRGMATMRSASPLEGIHRVDTWRLSSA